MSEAPLPEHHRKLLADDVKSRRTKHVRDPKFGFKHQRLPVEGALPIEDIEQQTGARFVAEGRDAVVWQMGEHVLKASDPERFPKHLVEEIFYTHKILALIFPDSFIAADHMSSDRDVSIMRFPYQAGDDFAISSPRNLHREMMYQFFRDTGLLHPVSLDYVGSGNLKVSETGNLVYVDYVHDLVLSREDKVKLLSYLIDRDFDESVLQDVSDYCDHIIKIKLHQ